MWDYFTYHACIAFILILTGCGIYMYRYMCIRSVFPLNLNGFNGGFSGKGIKLRRKASELPPVYPNGWFGLLESARLRISESTEVTAFGQKLAVFRDSKGKVYVLDAYCPHLGANLAVGGRVVGDCIECPFHGWKYRGEDGKCTEIPYSEENEVPQFAKIKTWVSREKNGWIFVWFHAENIEPTWEIPEIQEISTGERTLAGENEHIINAHIQEISENSADFVHFKQIHAPFSWNGLTNAVNWVRHEFTFNSWTRLPNPEGHIGQINFEYDVSVFGYSIPNLFRMNATAFQIGPGISHFYFEGAYIKFLVVHTITPLEPMVQKYTRSIYIHWAAPKLLGKIYMLGDADQIQRDILIWSNKKYVTKPVFSTTKEDTIIARHRRWYSQFYSENSPKFTFQKDVLDW